MPSQSDTAAEFMDWIGPVARGIEAAGRPAWKPRERCETCGRFLRKDSYYTNLCGDCWTPEDEF